MSFPTCFRSDAKRAAFSLLLAALPAALGAAEATEFKYDFGAGKVAPGYTQVLPDMTYSVERGYGFEPGAKVTAVDRGGDDALRGDFVTSEQPFLFSVSVPEGNYKVTVTLGDAAGESLTTVKAESRRLMLEKVATASGKFESHHFIVNVRNSKVPPPLPNAPGNDHVELNNRENGPNGLVFHWDDRLTLEFNNTAPKVCAIEIARVEVPTVFVLGDSTVTDQTREPGASWGQMLTRFLKPDVAVANHAESGETMKSFITELRLDKVLSQMKRGDYLLMQFGHNDEKANWPQTYVEAFTTYKAYMKVFIAEARRRGATPVVISPMQRRQFDDKGKIRNNHGDYPEAVRQVAQEEGVAFIDLSAMSFVLYEALGPEKAPLAFSGSAERRDPTHHNNYGAYAFAKCVVAGIRANKLDLAKSIVDDFTGFDPAKPDPVDTWSLPASPGRTTQAPRGN